MLGKIPEEIRKAVLVAWDAQRKTADALRPGATSKQLYETYTNFLSDTGYRHYSPYGSVHSIGMLECEAPFFSPKKDVVLVENSAVCIDAYFANLPWGSFRIENTYIVGKNSAELVTPFNSIYLKRFQ